MAIGTDQNQKFTGPQSTKKDILFLRQFLLQKKGLKLRKNIIFLLSDKFSIND